MRRARIALLALPLLLSACIPPNGGNGNGHTYYLSPTGNDATGTGAGDKPWQHFAKAFAVMQPGDLLVLRDGTYNDSLAPPASLSGTATLPVYVWAEHDGAARINGEATRVPIDIEGNDYFDIRGIVAYNSIGGVVTINGSSTNHAVGDSLRRVSAYNSAAPSTDPNHHVWEVWHADNTTIEDCVGAGRGRTIMTAMESDQTTVRRCWFRADAHTDWQNGSDQPVVQIYNATNSIVENNVVVKGAINTVVGIVDWDNVYGGPDSEVNLNNRYFGNVVTSDGEYGMSIGVTQCKLSRDHVWQDDVVVGSQIGFALRGGKNLTLTHDTAVGAGGYYGVWMNASVMGLGDDDCSPNNGNNTGAWGYYGNPPVQHAGFDFTAALSQSAINGYQSSTQLETHDNTPPTLTTSGNGTGTFDNATYGTGAYLLGGSIGARVVKRYVDGVLTDDSLWPWPMENRIWNETGDASLWQNANPMFPVAHQQSVMWDGVNGRTGGLWKAPPPSS